MADIAHLLLYAQNEIIDLRRRNELLQAKVDTMDLFALALRTTPSHQSVGMGEDVVWIIDKEIQEINRREAEKPTPREAVARDS